MSESDPEFDVESELKHLMMSYYHEDFDTLWSGLDQYFVDDPPDDQRTLLAELTALLAQPITEPELKELLWDLGSYVYLDDAPGGYRGWLEEIALRVRAHLGQ